MENKSRDGRLAPYCEHAVGDKALMSRRYCPECNGESDARADAAQPTNDVTDADWWRRCEAAEHPIPMMHLARDSARLPFLSKIADLRAEVASLKQAREHWQAIGGSDEVAVKAAINQDPLCRAWWMAGQGEALDRVADLRAELERVTAERDEARADCEKQTVKRSAAQSKVLRLRQQRDAALARAEKAEAQNAALREALEEATDGGLCLNTTEHPCDDLRGGGCRAKWCVPCFAASVLASEALAAPGGEADGVTYVPPDALLAKVVGAIHDERARLAAETGVPLDALAMGEPAGEAPQPIPGPGPVTKEFLRRKRESGKPIKRVYLQAGEGQEKDFDEHLAESLQPAHADPMPVPTTVTRTYTAEPAPQPEERDRTKCYCGLPAEPCDEWHAGLCKSLGGELPEEPCGTCYGYERGCNCPACQPEGGK